MPGGKPLAVPSNIVYVYDGSLAGFYCCVFESVYTHRIPAAIMRMGEQQPTLFEHETIGTNESKAKRVRDSLGKISHRVLELVETVFLSCLEDKELALLRYMLLAYDVGAKSTDMLGHPDVHRVLKAEQHLLGERHLLLGFIRFSDYSGSLAATITPKNFVLPLLAHHFKMRFSCEDFLIFDKTHKAALVYQNRQEQIIQVDSIDFPPADEKEQQYRELWKQFYRTIAIEARYNPKCRMTHMPKRYWENMLEVRDELYNDDIPRLGGGGMKALKQC